VLLLTAHSSAAHFGDPSGQEHAACTHAKSSSPLHELAD
jgi:hypothetical protein